MPTRKVYVVYGPSLEWGDGLGVVGYAKTLADAVAIIHEDIALYGTHPSDYYIDVVGVDYLPKEVLEEVFGGV